MFLLVSVRHAGAHPDELQHGVSIQSSVNLGKTFPRISRIRIIPSTQILARFLVYLPPFISKILDFICRMVLILILIYFEWRDTENQQFLRIDPFFRLNEEHFTCHLQYKHSGTFANREYQELSNSKKSENVRPHSSQSGRESATPSSGTSRVASYKEVPPQGLTIV